MGQFLKFLEQVASGVFNPGSAAEVGESIPGLMVNDADWAAWQSAVSQWDPDHAHVEDPQSRPYAVPTGRPR